MSVWRDREGGHEPYAEGTTAENLVALVQDYGPVLSHWLGADAEGRETLTVRYLDGETGSAAVCGFVRTEEEL